MAHFAKLNENNVVTEVIVVDDNELLDNGVESEAKGIAYCVAQHGGNWKQTHQLGMIRANFADVDFTYDASRDAFISPKPYDSWVLDESVCRWTAPTAMPTDGKSYIWDEPNLVWKDSALLDEVKLIWKE
jgi:hypothetical protein